MATVVGREADEERDEVLSRFMSDYVEYRALMARVQSSMSEGFLSMAQARKTLGMYGLGAARFPSQMTASKRVTTDTSNASSESDTTTATSSHRLRKREGKTLQASSVPAQDEAQASKKGISQADPIRWFSPLPPPALRHSQNQFQLALDDLLQLALVQARLLACDREYQTH